ncbi:MAG: efflux RND transporter periplasmic adaptor subunit [Myxococcaceae bacterium]|nr:efflux RND transporter periplasmic adaptor subunit [Myxococcaceae bacterium]
MNRIIPLVAFALLCACSRGGAATAQAAPAPTAPEATRPVKVETAEVQIQKMPRYLTLTGSVLADRQSEVAANVSGRVTATYVERGQPVKVGQVIARVDSKAASFQAQAADASARAANTQVEQARQDCARADQLFANGAITKAEYERQKTACTAQLYQANAARAQADLAGKLAGDTIIRAPIDGIIGERYVNVGEYVMPNSRVASVYAIDPVRVSISVPEPVVGQVHDGQTLEVEVSAYPDRKFPAVVKYVSPALRPNTRDLIVEATAANPDGALRPGMFATVLLLTGEEEVPTVPVEAIQVDGTVRRLFLAKNGTAQEMVVRTGVKKDGRIAVLETLQNGDQVVVAPPPGLRDGARLQ